VTKKLKVLVIRFSSIGDIVLTTPVLRCINSQLNVSIDFLTKDKYNSLLASNTDIENLILLSNDISQTIKTLQANRYDMIIDLHNNLRSFRIRQSLHIKSYVLSKYSLKRFILIYFGVDFLKNHVVDRYFETVKSIGVYNDKKGISYTLNPTTSIDFNTKQDYIAWVIGGSYETKKLSQKQIEDVISKLDVPVVLIGGNSENETADLIINNLVNKKIYNFCGIISLDQSALLIKYSKLVLTNDTGMMHISSAFSHPIISFWGCTKPSLGFYPYMPKNKVENLISICANKPCSKHGKKCNHFKNGCIKSIPSEMIYNTVKKLLK